MIKTLKRMYEHDQWAHGRTLASLRALEAPSERCRALFSHIVASRQPWLDLIDGKDAGGVSTWPQWSIEESAALAAETDARMAGMLDRFSHDDLAQTLNFTNASGQYLEFGWGDTLLHSLMHSQYHRAQLATEVKLLGGTPASTDYIVLCREEFLKQSSASG